MKSKTGNLRRFLPYYKKYIPLIILDLLCAGITSVCEIVLPLIVRFLTDMGINSPQSITIELILKVALLYTVLRLIDCGAYYFMSSVGHITGARIETDMRSDLFAHLQKLSFSYYSNTKIGQIMARITSDLFDVTEFSHHCPEEFFTLIMRRFMMEISQRIMFAENQLFSVLVFQEDFRKNKYAILQLRVIEISHVVQADITFHTLQSIYAMENVFHVLRLVFMFFD